MLRQAMVAECALLHHTAICIELGGIIWTYPTAVSASDAFDVIDEYRPRPIVPTDGSGGAAFDARSVETVIAGK
jgi:hypothetical protein